VPAPLDSTADGSPLRSAGAPIPNQGLSINTGFNIEVVERDKGVSVRIEGELDVATAPVLGESLIQAEASDAEVIVIDLTGVSFIDSTGLRALLEADARDRESPGAGRLQITGGSGQAQKLFKLAGVLDKLPFVAPSDE
jgi:anti-sigma B factor antagonist